MKKPDPVLDLLRTVPGLANLPDRALADLVPLVDEVTVQPGEVLAREGTSGRQAFVVVDGTGQVFVDGEVIATVGPGEFIGEMAMLDNHPRCATVRADSLMRLLIIGPSAFASFVEHPGVLKAMALQLNERLRRAEATSSH
ncbi:MAG: hypothetical protein QOI95_1042 [Acidimicrobiaceae bacterium]|jgi:CRP-like cAMP-binding protein